MFWVGYGKLYAGDTLWGSGCTFIWQGMLLEHYLCYLAECYDRSWPFSDGTLLDHQVWLGSYAWFWWLQLQCDSVIYCLGRLIIYCALHLVFHVFFKGGYWFFISYSFLFLGVRLGPSLISWRLRIRDVHFLVTWCYTWFAQILVTPYGVREPCMIQSTVIVISK
jgi:hypothetical protein